MLKKLLIVATVFLVAPLGLLAQMGSLSGSVIDQATGEPLVGVTVLFPELTRGAPTDINGEYRIDNVPVGTYQVRFSYVGYLTVTNNVAIQSGVNSLNILMRLDATGLNEVIITGVGSIERQAFTGSASTVRADRLSNLPVASVDQALKGVIPGLTVNSASGTPGAVQQIRIRGISSVNAGVAPLFVIDGVPVENGSLSASGSTSSFGIMANLNPNDVESITVLKDAAATAPYGARGSNGVIVITTKQGRQGKTEYTASYQRGVNSRAVDGEQPMDAATRKELLDQMRIANPAAAVADLTAWDGERNTNWLEEVTNETSLQQEFSISARGGNAATTFYVSGSAFNQEGHTIGSSVQRITNKIDVVHRFDDRIRVSSSLQTSFAEQDGYLEGGGFFGNPILTAYFLPSTLTPYNDDGSLKIVNFGSALFNPLYIQENDINRKRNYRLINNTKVDFNVAQNLLFTSRVSLDYIDTSDKLYRNRKYGDAVNFNGSVTDANSRNINYVWQNIGQYLFNLNANNAFTFKVISETQKNTFERIFATGRGIAADGLFNLQTTATPFSVGGSTDDWSVQSFTGLVNYGYNEKIYSDFSYRYEGNSRFAADKRWGSFWSAGLAYILTEEKFISDLKFLDYLRVRGSVGETGNAAIALNSYQAVVGFGAYGGQPAILPSSLGNNLLSWETAMSYDLAVEFEMLKRLSGSVTYFRKNSQNLLLDVPLSRTTGHTSQRQNIGELFNEGAEIELNVSLARSRNFSWTVGGNYTQVKNEVTKLPVDGDGNKIEIRGATQLTAVEGYAVGSWFMRTWAGVNPDNGDPMWWKNIVDADGNVTGREKTSVYSQATLYDQKATALPKAFGSFNTNINFLGFYANATMYYAFGYKIYDNWAGFQRGDGANFGFNQYARQADRWQQAGDVAANPRPVFGGNKLSNNASSRFLYKGDHLRLQDLRVGYNVPASMLGGTGLTGANVYFLGTNVWTHAFDKDLKHDPAVPADGFTALLTPQMRTFTFGVLFNF